MLSGVYCWVSKDSNVQEVYVGSTEDLNKRIETHKNACIYKTSNEYNRKLYRFIRENGGFDNWKFIWLELFKTDDTIFLRQLEQIWMDTFPQELLLNGYRAYATEEEKKEQLIKGKKKYYKKNKDLLLKKAKKYYEKKNKVKVPCPKCNKIMNKGSITPHLKICAKNTN